MTPTPQTKSALYRRKRFLSPPVVLGLFLLGLALALVAGWIAADAGITPIGVLFYGACGFATIIVFTSLLFQLDRREDNRARRANERIGWSAVEAETARKLAAMRRDMAEEEAR